MAWTEFTPGVFKTDFSGLEKIYYKMSTAFGHIGREHWGIHCVCGLRSDSSFLKHDIVPALREAWKALMIEFPGLSVVPDGLTKIFVIPDAQAANHWVDQTFFVETARNADTIIANSKVTDLPSLFYLPSSSEIVFLSQHWRIDAIGTCMLLDRLFSRLVQPQDLGSSPGRPVLEKISPSLEDAAGSPEDGPPPLQQFAREYINNFHKKALNTGGLPYKGDPATLPASTTHQDVMLTRDSTSALVAACKSRSISVSAAIHTALAHTVFAFAPPEDQLVEYTAVMAVNMRAYLQSPYNTKTHACQTYVAGITPSVQRNSNFSDATDALTREYKSWCSDKFMQSLRLIYKYHADQLFTDHSEGVPSSKPPSGVTISSLGIIQQYLTGDYGNAVYVDRFRFGVSMMTRQMLLYVWTFRGQLILSVNYNAAYYDISTAQEVLSRIGTTLEKELRLELYTMALKKDVKA